MPAEDAPIGFALTNTGDLEITGAGLRIVSGIEAVAINIEEALGTIKGEYFLDLELGLDYFGSILGEKYNEQTVLALIRKAILGVDGVDQMISLVPGFNGLTREFTCTWEVSTTFGPLQGEFEA